MTTLPTRQSAFENAPMQDLMDVLLRQFTRPLASVGIELDTTTINQVAQDVAEGRSLDNTGETICVGLTRVVKTSEDWFTEKGFTWERSMATEMGDMPGWETTAEFLELANEKSNHELRIAGASALLVAMGADSYKDRLLFLAANPHLDEVSAVMATRILEFVEDSTV